MEQIAPNRPGNNQNVNVQVIAPFPGAPPKSVGVALLLTFFFGGLGMLYSTVIGGIVMLFVEILIMTLTLGLGVIITRPICMIWAAMAANSANRRPFQSFRPAQYAGV